MVSATISATLWDDNSMYAKCLDAPVCVGQLRRLPKMNCKLTFLFLARRTRVTSPNWLKYSFICSS